MPTPRPNEKRSDFVSRCIPIVLDDGTAEDNKQAAAVCYSMYKQAKEKKMSNVNLSADVQTFADAGEDKPFDFELVGYTGKVMEKGGWRGIFSLDGMESKGGKVIILREHERDRIVGYGETFKDERGFIVRGKFSKTTKDGIEVAGLLKEGIPLQCSVGIAPESVREAKAGETINSFSVPQGMQVWDKSYVGEVSICSWGVDTDTSVHSFAKEIEMSEKELKELCEESETKETPIEETPVEAEETETEAPVEETEEEPKEEPAKDKELKFSQADLDAAVSAERGRVAAIFAADAPMELAKEAIENGFSEGEAFKFFWMSEKGMKADALSEMVAEAPVVESDKKADADMMEVELSYMELIGKVKEEQSLSHVEATKYVMKHHPESYKKFMGRK
jgi:phage head maturation protease